MLKEFCLLKLNGRLNPKYQQTIIYILSLFQDKKKDWIIGNIHYFWKKDSVAKKKFNNIEEFRNFVLSVIE